MKHRDEDSRSWNSCNFKKHCSVITWHETVGTCVPVFWIIRIMNTSPSFSTGWRIITWLLVVEKCAKVEVWDCENISVEFMLHVSMRCEWGSKNPGQQERVGSSARVYQELMRILVKMEVHLLHDMLGGGPVWIRHLRRSISDSFYSIRTDEVG